jgi:hypothetical protein
MNIIRHIRRLAGTLIGVAAAMAAFGAGPAFAMRTPSVPVGGAGVPVPPPSVPAGRAALPVPLSPAPVRVHTIVAGGMPGWQIALIAIGAALLAATVAVLLDRARASRRSTVTAAA